MSVVAQTLAIEGNSRLMTDRSRAPIHRPSCTRTAWFTMTTAALPIALQDIVSPKFHQNNFSEESFIKNELGIELDKGTPSPSLCGPPFVTPRRCQTDRRNEPPARRPDLPAVAHAGRLPPRPPPLSAAAHAAVRAELPASQTATDAPARA